MSRLGQKISRNVQQLGDKFKNATHQLGDKAGEVLRGSDTILRKVQNTLQNKVIPASALLMPEATATGVMALGAVKALRSNVAPARAISDRLEKINLRKEAENLAQNLTDRGSHFV